ncbi:hypothetical protein CE91St36_19770 [Christensenellaceae bacterium]|uniref:AAA family ATPase n=1 Tax=Christensenella timonensis TaxID=1816678 RepID=UPI00082D7995|nr:AAA family ATPase [Christensenella timonensis]BDF59160.1 hypothetical protein CE91St36_19770 [Christensenellaceae bacterium]BDF61826.1 hypothetical protein CE91St37_19760 [Christensenellaceae bacterium]
MKTLVVNLFGGPGAGKTAAAWEIAKLLKTGGILTEYIPEYAKELVWAERFDLLDGSFAHQLRILEEQNRRLKCVQGKVDVAVTDSPVILGLIYQKYPSEDLKREAFKAYNSYCNFNLFIERPKDRQFEQAGRIHTEKESLEKDREIINLLKGNRLYYGTYSRDSEKLIVKNIVQHMQRINKMERQENMEEKSDSFICETRACIQSLHGKMGNAKLIRIIGENDYLAEYNGVQCHANFDWDIGQYYISDLSGIIKEKTSVKDKLDKLERTGEHADETIQIADELAR